ncbi:MAG TPA: GNAT family N-acetyltransferase [Thermoleophilaceae bacterium]|nr:GNAT family N-acetyltransferase [Thermoleophilaceae bacterium]
MDERRVRGRPVGVAGDAPDPLGEGEAALATHWSHFGRLPGGSVHEEDGLVWFETGIRHLPYNGVVRSRLPDGSAADEAIGRVLGRMAERGADVWWAVHPTATPADLAERLAAFGLERVERVTFMYRDLDELVDAPAESGLTILEVGDADTVRAYSDLTISYWEVPPEEREAVAAIQRNVIPSGFPGRRFLALLDGEPVAKGALSFAAPPGVAGIYGMSVLPAARGRGVAAGLTRLLLRHARESGCRRVVLHSTDMAVSLYRRAGFTVCGEGEVFATAPIWSHDD